jgi:IAA-amino acid hydrolase
MSGILDQARRIRKDIVAIRREIHAHPELMYDLHQTGAVVCRELEILGIPYRRAATTGVVATLGREGGPCVALRADMDALPIQEETPVPFASRIPGRMHACGHDAHTAMLLGAARLLKDMEPALPGTVVLLFQPAEEGGAGGLRMCDDGALTSPPVARIFGLHVWPQLPVGAIAGRAGPLLAGVSTLKAVISGKGGHGAMPHLAIDPVVAAAKAICELQTIVSREVDAQDSGVVSVTTIHAGEASNVIPSEVHLGGTLRSLTIDGLCYLKERVRTIIEGTAAMHRCRASVEFIEPDTPATVNDAEAWAHVQEVGGLLLGSEAVHEMRPIMGAEDFSFYLRRVPGCFAFLGVQPDSGEAHGVHHPRFDINEDALPIGAALHTSVALGWLRQLAGVRTGQGQPTGLP